MLLIFIDSIIASLPMCVSVMKSWRKPSSLLLILLDVGRLCLILTVVLWLWVSRAHGREIWTQFIREGFFVNLISNKLSPIYKTARTQRFFGSVSVSEVQALCCCVFVNVVVVFRRQCKRHYSGAKVIHPAIDHSVIHSFVHSSFYIQYAYHPASWCLTETYRMMRRLRPLYKLLLAGEPL